jgi:hypothetical protein
VAVGAAWLAARAGDLHRPLRQFGAVIGKDLHRGRNVHALFALHSLSCENRSIAPRDEVALK